MELDAFLYLGSVPKVQKPEGTHSSIVFPKGLVLIQQGHHSQTLDFFPLTGFRNKWEHRVTGKHFTPRALAPDPSPNPRDRAASSCPACPWQCPPKNALAQLFPKTKACKSKAGSAEEQSLAKLHLGCGFFAHLPWAQSYPCSCPAALAFPCLPEAGESQQSQLFLLSPVFSGEHLPCWDLGPGKPDQ